MIKKIRKLQEKIDNNIGLKILFGLIKTICWLVLILFLIVILVQKFSNNNFAIAGYRIFNVSSGSMKPEYKIGDIIIDEEVLATDLKVGDNVTYLGAEGDFENIIVTHKIIEIKEDNGNYSFITKGTANDIADPEITFSQIIGRVCYKTTILSYISRFMTNIYAYFIIFSLVGIISSYQIVNAIYEEKENDGEEDKEN